jgi:mannose-6-phosphate isomerase-like protein (cupin superfamily)
MEPIFLAPGEGGRGQMPGESFTVKASGETTNGLLAFAEGQFAARHGTFLHRHMNSAEAFWVLEGNFLIDIEDRAQELGPGGFALVPPGSAHRITNVGDSPGKVIGLYAPAGPEAGFRAVRERAAELGTIPSEEEVTAILASRDIIRIGPARMRFDDRATG